MYTHPHRYTIYKHLDTMKYTRLYNTHRHSSKASRRVLLTTHVSMCMYVCVCKYVCKYVCMCMYVCVCMYVYASMYASMHVSMHVSVPGR